MAKTRLLKLSEWFLSKKKVIEKITFLVYCFFIAWETLLTRKPASIRSYEPRLFWGFTEFINGEDNGEYVSKQYLLNILFFMPFGFLFPWKKKMRITIIAACVFSVLIEFTQYVTARGLCELDDVIANTIGALIGAELYKLIKKNRVKKVLT